MKKRMKKLTMLLGVMVMSCMMLTGCSGCGKENTNVAVDTPVTVESSEVVEVAESTSSTEESETAESSEEVEISEAATEESVEEVTEATESSEEAVESVEESKEVEETEPSKEAVEESEESKDTKPSNESIDNGNNGGSDTKPSDNGNGNGGGNADNSGNNSSSDNGQTPTPPPAPEPTPEPQQPEVHVHSWVEDVVEATCETGRVITTRCSSCGEVQGTRTEGSGLGHDFVEKYLYYASCNSTGYKSVRCSRCDAIGPGHGDIPMLPHTFYTYVWGEGDCRTPKVTQNICSVCNYHEPKVEDWEAHANDHVWKTSIIQVWSDEAFAMVDVERTFCEICNMDKP